MRRDVMRHLAFDYPFSPSWTTWPLTSPPCLCQGLLCLKNISDKLDTMEEKNGENQSGEGDVRETESERQRGRQKQI